ncbi:MAG: SDR family NAD(P)-dependent oxidoreductase [Flavipsychrobacter sp.]
MEKHKPINTINGKVVLITGANRGIGRALLEEALKRGTKRVYAGSRTHFSHPDHRVVPLILDITKQDQISEAAEKVSELDILINNAGISLYDNLSDRTKIEQQLAVNFYGTYDVIQAFLPQLLRSKGTIVNNLSLAVLAPFAPIASYCISKAAAFSMTQSLRAFLSSQGVTVQAVLTGPIDTEMTKDINLPKSSPKSAAEGIMDGIEQGNEEIFPDAASAMMAESWYKSGAKLMERQNASFLTAQ